MKSPPLVYIAGPYTKPDPVANTHHMIRIADALLDLGVVPIIPHLTMFWHLVCPRPYDQWLQYDLHVMSRCDVVLRVPGDSNGADGEVLKVTRSGQTVIVPLSADVSDCVLAVKVWMEENETIDALHSHGESECRTTHCQ